MSFFDEITRFLLSSRSRMVLIPFVIVLLLFAVLFTLLEGSAWTPFVYAIF